MRLSVVITTRNEADNIENCIRAFDKFRDCIEIIVVDNQSTDATKSIAASLGAVVLDKGPERTAQRNLGFKTASSPWVLVLDADMILIEKTIVEILDACTIVSEIDAYWIPEVRVGDTWRVKCRNFERSFYDGTCVDALRLFKKKVLLESGGYDENLMAGGEDWELDIRVLELGARCAILKNHLLHNERKLSFKCMLEKKAYYSKSTAAYRAKWPNHPNVKRQFSLYYRYLGVFIEGGKWKKILAHPLLFCGVILERIAVGAVYLLNK